MKNILSYKIFTLFLLPLFASCQLLSGNTEGDEGSGAGVMEIHSINFSEDLTEIYVVADQKKGVPDFYPEDSSSVTVKVYDMANSMIPFAPGKQPLLKKIEWAGMDGVEEQGLGMLALVDLTRPAGEMISVKRTLKRLYASYGDNMFVSFMFSEGKVSYVFPLTPYVIDTYVNNIADLTIDESIRGELNLNGASYLYRGASDILDKLVAKNTGTYLDSASRVSFLIFSSVDLYDEENNYPLDPKHFEYQQHLLDVMKVIPEDISVFFMDGKISDDEDDEASRDDDNMMSVLCESTGGRYLSNYDATSFLRGLFSSYGIYIPDYKITLQNRIGNLYFGQARYMKLDFYNRNDSLVASAMKSYRESDIYHPISVGNVPRISIFIYGLVRLVILFLLSFIITQFLIPAVRYYIFTKKYIIEYKGPRQSVNGIAIPETCYMCKAPFKAGDKVVAKCSHVVHQGCWDENEYHCPEYGVSCNEGSHYYDKKHPYNHRNAPFYADWILVSIIAAALSWISFLIFRGHFSFHIVDAIVDYLVRRTTDVTMQNLDILSARHYTRTLLAYDLALFSTFALSFFSVHRRKWSKMIPGILLRSLAAGIASFIVFGFQCISLVARQEYEDSIFFAWIPWSVSVLCIEYAVVINSNFRPKHTKILYSAVIIGIISSLAFKVIGNIENSRDLVMMVYVEAVFMTSVALAVCEKRPKRKKCYLHLSGGLKEMDVALYKWFHQNPSAIVTIGRSVDCSLQLHHPTDKILAPIHASIKMVNGAHKLFVSDNDVIINRKMAKHNRSYTLYYGDVFEIGGVKFTYLGI